MYSLSSKSFFLFPLLHLYLLLSGWTLGITGLPSTFQSLLQILGVAHGISILSDLDIVTCILLAMFVAGVLPFFIAHLVRLLLLVFNLIIPSYAA